MPDLIQKGRLQASLLAGAWRASQEPPALTSEELAGITPVLLETGAGGLAWRRLRGSSLALTPSGMAFQQAYRLHSLRVALKEDDTRRAIVTLRAAGVEPLLLKGWAVARSYPQRGLRPYGDIDLLVHAEDLQPATLALTKSPRLNTTVELHPGLVFPADASTAELFGHSRLDWMDSLQVRVLGPEDQLRYLCLHLFKHGARRPLLLVDIALILESIPPEFDWEFCLRGSKLQSDWITCVLMLSHIILGARRDAVPNDIARRALPEWVVPAVLRQWGIGMRHYSTQYAEDYLRNPREIPRMVADRWPNAIETTVWAGLPINSLPRFPLQFIRFLYGAAIYPPHALLRSVGTLLNTGRSKPPDARGVRAMRQHTVLQADRPWDSP